MNIRNALVTLLVLEAMVGGCSSTSRPSHGADAGVGGTPAASGGMASGGVGGSGGSAGAGGTAGIGGAAGAGGVAGAGGATSTGGMVGTGGVASVDAGVSTPDGGRTDVAQDAVAPDVALGADSGASAADGPDRSFAVPAGATCYAPVAAPPPASACAANLCGNGQVDTCTTNINPCDHGTCPPLTATEECDGTQLQGQTCIAAGFAGGALRCTNTCHLDWSGCEVCAVDPRIAGCAAVDGTNLPSSGLALAVASNGTKVAMVWPTLSSGSVTRLRLGLVNDDLSITAGDCLAEGVVNPAPVLAPSPTGWLLAYQHAPGDGTYWVQLVAFDAAGQMVSMPAASIAGAPTGLVARPNAMPLLLYSVADASGTTSSNMAALLDSSGKPVWTVRIGKGGDSKPVAVYTGDGFLWTDRAALAADPVLARIGLDGTVTTTTLPLGEDNYDPRLVWTGTEARMLWYGSWIALDKMGTALGPVHRLTSGQTMAPEAAVLGTNTAVLLMPVEAAATATGPRDLVVIDAAGNATAPATIFADGNQGPRIQGIAAVQDRLLAVAFGGGQRVGPRIYVAWIRP
ncbi:MAG TPA: hypothetical protein VF550_02140 [Polyangia bacterium]